MKHFCVVALFFSLTAHAQTLREVIATGKPILCAHRGGMYDAWAENSINTLDYLLKSFGVAPVMAEIDVRKSKDGTLWLMHDNTVDRTTNGTGKVEELADTYLQSLFLKNGRGEVTKEHIPTFADVLQYASRKTVYLMLDVKIDDWKAVLDQVKVHKVDSHCMVLTFTTTNSKSVSALAPHLLVSCLVRDENDFAALQTAGVPVANMMAYVGKTTTDSMISTLKAKGIPLVTDASEATTNASKTYPIEFYKTLVGPRGINVLVSDLPVEVQLLLK